MNNKIKIKNNKTAGALDPATKNYIDNKMRSVSDKERRISRLTTEVAHDDKRVSRLAAYLAAPKDFEAEPLCDSYSTRKVTLASPFRTFDINHLQGTALEQAQTDYCVQVTRNPFCAEIITYNNTTNLLWAYKGGFQGKNAARDLGMYGTLTWDPASIGGGKVGTKIHGDYQYPQKSLQQGGYCFYWLNQQEELALSWATAADYTLDIYILKSGQRTAQLFTTNTGTAATGSGMNNTGAGGGAGWYAFILRSLSVNQPVSLSHKSLGAGSGTVSGITPNFGMRSLPGFDAMISSVEELRIIGASILYTNTSNVLARGGNIAGYQIPGSEEFYDWINYSVVASAEESVAMDATNGCYGFLKPTQPADFNYYPVNEMHCGNLDSISDTLEIISSIPYNPNGSGRNAQVTVSFAVEFKTPNVFFNAVYPDPNTQVIDGCFGIMCRMTQFTENPLHLKDIKQFIGKAMGKVAEYAPKVISAVKNYGPMVARTAAKLAPLLL